MARFAPNSLLSLVLLLALIPILAGNQAAAQGSEQDPRSDPVALSADRMTYDDQTGDVAAAGNVELSQAGRVLIADKVTYNQKSQVVIASGNISLMEPSGEVLFTNYVELTDGLKNGFIEQIRLFLADGGKMAALRAERTDNELLTMEKAVYSPCKICADKKKDGNAKPLWQLRAYKVKHSQEDKRITYNHAFLDIYGVPVAYVPYFSHPDPSVKRKSGFLAPKIGRSSELGTKVETPFYYPFSDSRDLTVSPLYTSREGVVMQAEYRERTKSGGYEFSGSVTRPDERDDFDGKIGGKNTRGHLKAVGQFDLGSGWLWGFDAARSTDDTYLLRYDLDSADTLTSRLYLEGYRSANYAAVNFYSFQGLKEDDNPGETASVLPMLEYSYLSQPSALGARVGLDAYAHYLYRRDGGDTQQLSTSGHWVLPYISERGAEVTITAKLRGDLYNTVGQINTENAAIAKDSEFTARALPALAFDWRYPLVRRSGNIRQVIEPITAIILAPNGGNPGDIPNEDSLSFVFDDTNLFNLNRFSGLDRWESGTRAMVGVKLGSYGTSGSSTSLLVGQVLRLKDNNDFPSNSGAADAQSDFVGRFNMRTGKYFDLSHRFRIARDELDVKRNQVKLAMGPERWKLKADYVALDDEISEKFGDREEVNLEAMFQITRYWRAEASWRRDLKNAGTLSNSIGFLYTDECIEFGVAFEQRLTRDREVEPSTSINFHIILAHLG